ncbi:MAG: hypothetical protein R2827_07235 [Bdellovibrionales bacterium]
MKAIRARALIATIFSMLLLSACGKQDDHKPAPTSAELEPIELLVDVDLNSMEWAKPSYSGDYSLLNIKLNFKDETKGARLQAESQLQVPGKLDDSSDTTHGVFVWGSTNEDWRQQIKIFVPQTVTISGSDIFFQGNRRVQFGFFADYKGTSPLRRVSAGAEENVTQLANQDVILIHELMTIQYVDEGCQQCYFGANSILAPIQNSQKFAAPVVGEQGDTIIIVIKTVGSNGEEITFNIEFLKNK